MLPKVKDPLLEGVCVCVWSGKPEGHRPLLRTCFWKHLRSSRSGNVKQPNAGACVGYVVSTLFLLSLACGIWCDCSLGLCLYVWTVILPASQWNCEPDHQAVSSRHPVREKPMRDHLCVACPLIHHPTHMIRKAHPSQGCCSPNIAWSEQQGAASVTLQFGRQLAAKLA